MEKREEFLLNLFFYKLLMILICLSHNSFSQNQTINNFSNTKTKLLKIHIEKGTDKQRAQKIPDDYVEIC